MKPYLRPDLDPRYSTPARLNERRTTPLYVPREKEPAETDGPVRQIVKDGKPVTGGRS
jgi:hypothetical protein